MDSLIDGIQYIVDGLKFLIDWSSSGIYVFFEDWFKEAAAWFVVAAIKFKVWAVGFSWDVAKIVLHNIGLSQYISNAWTALSPQTLGYLSFFKVPEALNILFQALVTRITLAVMGW